MDVFINSNWWVGFLDVLALGLVLFFIFKWRIKVVQKRKNELEEQVKVRTEEILSKNSEIHRQQNEIIGKQNETERIFQELTDSIKTAQRIQISYLPPDEKIKKYLPDSFVLYLPKDIVSGDFYWLHVKYGKIYLAAVDCTGHGVAGAFMSIIGANMLKQIVIENPTYNAGEILSALSTELIQSLNQQSDNAITKDGMDASLCIIDTDENIMHYAGANSPLYVINNNELKVLTPDKYGVGLQKNNVLKPFTNHVTEVKENDKFYLFSDGFASQFGGHDGNQKLKYNKFRDFLLYTSQFSFSEQKNILHEKLNEWQGNTEQTDDILVIGFSVPISEEF